MGVRTGGGTASDSRWGTYAGWNDAGQSVGVRTRGGTARDSRWGYVRGWGAQSRENKLVGRGDEKIFSSNSKLPSALKQDVML